MDKQTRFLAAVRTKLEAAGLIVEENPQWENIGSIEAFDKEDAFGMPVFTLSYNFQRNYETFRGTINPSGWFNRGTLQPVLDLIDSWLAGWGSP